MTERTPTAMTASMPGFTFPLGGNVAQTFRIWANAFDGAQFGLINIDLGATPDPELERAIVSKVGSYGRQLGRLSEALEVLLDRLEAENVLTPDKMTPDQTSAIRDFRCLLSDIKSLKPD